MKMLGGWGKDKEIACQLPSQAKKPEDKKANLLPIKIDLVERFRLGSEKQRKNQNQAFLPTQTLLYSQTQFPSFLPGSSLPHPKQCKEFELFMVCPSPADGLSSVCGPNADMAVFGTGQSLAVSYCVSKKASNS